MRSAPLRLMSVLCAAVLTIGTLVQPALAGVEDGLKALQAGDMPAAEKALQLLAKERDPRAQFLLGFYVYGNPDSKLFDMDKGVPLLLDAAERWHPARHRASPRRAPRSRLRSIEAA